MELGAISQEYNARKALMERSRMNRETQSKVGDISAQMSLGGGGGAGDGFTPSAELSEGGQGRELPKLDW
jgi:hypothetical protein